MPDEVATDPVPDESTTTTEAPVIPEVLPKAVQIAVNAYVQSAKAEVAAKETQAAATDALSQATAAKAKADLDMADSLTLKQRAFQDMVNALTAGFPD